MNVHLRAALRPTRNIHILSFCFSPRPLPAEKWCFLKVYLKGSVLSTDNTIKLW